MVIPLSLIPFYVTEKAAPQIVQRHLNSLSEKSADSSDLGRKLCYVALRVCGCHGSYLAIVA